MSMIGPERILLIARYRSESGLPSWRIEFVDDNNVRKLISDTAWIGASKVSAVVFLVAFNYLLIRNVSLSTVGQFFVLYGIVTVLPSMVLTGTNFGVIKIVSEARDKGDIKRLRTLMQDARLILVLGAVVLAAIGGVAAKIFADRAGQEVYALMALGLVLWLISYQLRLLLAGLARGWRDFRSGALIENVVFQLGSTVALGVLVYCGFELNLEGLIWLCAIWSIIPLVLMMGRFSRQDPGDRRSTGAGTNFFGRENTYISKHFRSFFNLSVYLMLVALFPVLLNQSGVWFAGGSLGDEAAGLYGAAFRLMQVAALPSMIYGILIRPYVSDYLGSKRPQIIRSTLFATRAFFLFYMIISLVLIRYGQPIIDGLFGSEYHEVYQIMVVLVLGRLAYAALGPAEIALSFLGKERFVVLSSYFIAAVILGIWLFWFDISLLSIAVAVSLAFFARSVSIWWVCVRELQWDTSVFGIIGRAKVRETA